ncbi:sigma 54-interacting transcriptional regulator [Lentisphaera profundi]|uniref:Sigma 54-interacting transcriptional regulator n=1 Tax=Lentisphaera profundi TaxID=1658616 RepID=A0ABY7VSP1_9BACT|nr:sigma 54-interacting transcriptional regulator [Lentisphaera profundi]WDE96278.1 sigma 54-interacting transcriptional regulator [Lentisphaera profundi]
MRKNQTIPMEILQNLQFNLQPQSFALSVGEALNKLFAMPLMEISWGLRDGENFPVYCYQKLDGQGSSSLFDRQTKNSLAKELIDDEAAFVIEDFTEENDEMIEVRKAYLMGAEQLIVLPLFDRLGVNGFLNLYLSDKTEAAYWETLFSQLCPLASASLTFSKKLNKTATASRRAWSELRDLQNENSIRGAKPFIRESSAMNELWTQVCILAPRLSEFWIIGTPGSGRELCARHIHARSGSVSKRLEVFDCASIPIDIHYSEIFGEDNSGLWYKLNGGSLYIKNIELLDPKVNAKIIEKIKTDIRLNTEAKNIIISSQSENLNNPLKKHFENAAITFPNFNDRRDDWLWLLRELVAEIANNIGVAILEITPSFTQYIMQQNWSDDFSEIREFLTKSLISSRGRTLKVPSLNEGENQSKAGRPPANLDSSVQQQIIKALRKCKGKVYGSDGAASLLGLHASTLQGKMRKFNLIAGDFKK